MIETVDVLLFFSYPRRIPFVTIHAKFSAADGAIISSGDADTNTHAKINVYFFFSSAC